MSATKTRLGLYCGSIFTLDMSRENLYTSTTMSNAGHGHASQFHVSFAP
jgi:hypothetical protein